VVAFVYCYGLYKGAGTEVVDIARGTRTVEEVSSETGRGLPTVLLGDLARADMQALVLDRQLAGGSEWGSGSTYLAAPLSLVPGSPANGGPRDKSAVGTAALYGTGAYEAGARAERVFGLAGEAMLNFGPLGGLLSFTVLGLFLRFARRCYTRAVQGVDLAPKLVCPVLCAITVILLTADLDNILAFVVGKALPLVLVVWCAMTREPPARTGSALGSARPVPAQPAPVRPANLTQRANQGIYPEAHDTSDSTSNRRPRSGAAGDRAAVRSRVSPPSPEGERS
jgi:hypothetical protein